jgi:chaperone required for assembly of F1-ATPase
MKRFWDTADVAAAGDGWSVQLDGKPLRLPGGAALRVPARALAEAIAAEWQAAGGARGGTTSYADLPLTRLAGTAQERVVQDPEPVALAIARYGETDLLCYRADRPAALVQRQAERWQPWLDWAAKRFGATLRSTSGLVHVAQPPEALAVLAAAVAAQPAWRLAGLGVAIPALGSLVLGLAVAEFALAADEAYEVSVLEERFQAELWGEDAEASARRAQIRAEVEVAGRFMALAEA